MSATGRSSAFTLVELLVVLAVCGVLTSLLVPALRAASEKANHGRDASNLRQIGAALLMYAGENGGRFPQAGGPVTWYGTSPGGRPAWARQIAPYIGDARRVFASPRNPEESGYFLGSRPAMAAEGRFAPVVLQRMEAPSQTILGGVVGAPEMFTPGDWDKDDYTQSPAFDDAMRSRLAPSIGILFADGHVRECAEFDPGSMTTEYRRGCWYSF
jgi:prepilin-type N-terminal cleavage/methylation domain-containing protein